MTVGSAFITALPRREATESHESTTAWNLTTSASDGGALPDDGAADIEATRENQPQRDCVEEHLNG